MLTTSTELYDCMDTIEKETTFVKNSCWNLQDPQWIESAHKFKVLSDSIYVHYNVLEWMVNIIDENILSTDFDLRCSVDEVFHHNYEGNVYCLRFYRNLKSRALASILQRSYYVQLSTIMNEFKYKMPWKSKSTYFLRIDSIFDERKKFIMRGLQRLDLLGFIQHTTELTVNWMYMKKIEIYEFSSNLTAEQVQRIDFVFESVSKSVASLYIAKEFSWHKLLGEFIAVDKLAIDICAGEWSHYSILKDFSFNDILQLDMANKDYRDPYYNEYLDRYLKRLLAKWYPEILSDIEVTYDFLIPPERDHKLNQYFINKFEHKIANLCVAHEKDAIHYSSDYLPLQIPKSKDYILLRDKPHPDELKPTITKYGSVTFILTNYVHFSDSLFRYLLNHPNRHQSYCFRFNVEFNFRGQVVVPIDLSVFPMDKRSILVELDNWKIENVVEMQNFLEYLQKLFCNVTNREHVELSLTFTDCDGIDDCPIVEWMAIIFDGITFSNSKCSGQQLRRFSSHLTSRNKLRFYNSHELNDESVMLIVLNSDMDIENLTIEGSSSCTPLLYFNLSEYVMNKEGVHCIRGTRFRNTERQYKSKFKNHLPTLEFFRSDNSIQIRNYLKKQVLDLYCLVNDLPSDDDSPPFDYD